MPNLERLYRWEKFVPDLGENRNLEQPFFLELAVGLTKEQMRTLGDSFSEQFSSAATATEAPGQKVAELFGGLVRLGAEPLTVEGRPITTLAEYFELCAGLRDLNNLMEVSDALFEANSYGGMRQVFFKRLSGGFTSTAATTTGKGGSQRAAR